MAWEQYYKFDLNRRIYEKDGVRKHSPYYEEHFIPIEIIDENEKEFITRNGTINKRSMMLKLNSNTRVRVFTEKEKEDDIYKNAKIYDIISNVRRLDTDSLKEVEAIILKFDNERK